MLKNLLQYLLFSILSFLLLLVVIIVIAVATMGPNVKENSILVLNLSGPVLEEGPQGFIQRFFMGDVLTTREIMTSLEKARKDSKIKGLLVSSINAQMGFGKTQEIREGIKRFASAKPVYGFIEDGDPLEYYLCSAAPKLYLAPAGEGGVNITGLRSETPFFKGTLDKLGIVAQMDHIGEYKSASDIWTRDSMSEAHREATESLLNSLYDRLASDIAKDRKLTADRVKQIIDEGPPIRSEAKQKGLVDELLYRDQVEEKIKKDLKLSKISWMPIREYKEPTFSETYRGANKKIGIIYASGAIMPGESNKGFEEDTLGSVTITKALREAKEDDSVKAIVLRVDSPGGSAVASDLIWREVIITKIKKPVVVSMGDVAASGGYYISMGASKVLADPSTITGSIGVVFGKFWMKGLYDKIGLNKEVIQRGKHADLFSDYVPFNDEEWNIIHRHMHAIYDSFTKKAAEGRKKTQSDIDAIGKGRVWSGDQALKIGLIDQLGGLQDAIWEARKLAKISDKEETGFAIFPAR
ncbi:signal peptide peptidase SppA, partial [bacterium]|nr:signal peptide peptidase SppA [bacterium]